MRPSGTLYTSCEWDERTVRRLIIERKIAPFYPGQDQPAPDREECPICMMVSRAAHAAARLRFFSRAAAQQQHAGRHHHAATSAPIGRRPRLRRRRRHPRRARRAARRRRRQRRRSHRSRRPPAAITDFSFLLSQCYPGGLNRSLCCKQGICSECYLQVRAPFFRGRSAAVNPWAEAAPPPVCAGRHAAKRKRRLLPVLQAHQLLGRVHRPALRARAAAHSTGGAEGHRAPD